MYVTDAALSLFLYFADFKMAKRTKKVGVVGKYGTRYGASLRKSVKKMEISQHARYNCQFCGKVNHPPNPEKYHFQVCLHQPRLRTERGCGKDVARLSLTRTCSLLSGVGRRQAFRRWNLELPALPQDHCRRCMDAGVSCKLLRANESVPRRHYS